MNLKRNMLAGADLGYLKGGWLRKVFEKRAANKLAIAHIYYHYYIRTLDICSHLFIQLLYIYSYKLTQQYHYSNSGCLIVYKER